MTYKKINTIPLLGNLTAQQFQLTNGLHVAIVVDATTPIFSYQTWYRVGSADEKPGYQGLAHLFEHMMFRKTSRREMGEWEREVNAHGGTGINAYTSRDQTVYFFTFPKEQFVRAADLEADRMANLVIEQEMFETEKGAVLTERNRGLDEPTRFLWEEMYKLSYTQHPYRYSIIGEEESIKSFSVEEARAFYQQYYSSNNALIIVVGDVVPEMVMETIASQYGNFPERAHHSRSITSEPLQLENYSRIVHHRKATQEMLAKAWHIPNMLHEDYPALAMIGKLLTSGKTSLLLERLVNNGKTTSIFADVYIGRDLGTFEFFAQIAHEESSESIEKIFLDSLKELAEGNISEEQIQIVKNNIEKDFYHSITSPSGLARMLGDSFVCAGDIAHEIQMMEKIQHTTRADVQRVVKRYLLEGKSATISLLPE